jgi:hypothetical protein
MIGNNTLELNQATMVMAIQYWLESVMMPKHVPKVISVVATTSGYDKMFEVRVESTEEMGRGFAGGEEK